MKKIKKQNLGIRHGDIPLHLIKELPKKCSKVASDSFVLALGETTGHKHVIKGSGLQVFQSADGRFYLKVMRDAVVTHEEHKTLTVFPGIYEVGKEREMDWFGLVVKKVLD
jgi:hypothetical protein